MAETCWFVNTFVWIYMHSRQRGARGAQITHRPSSSQTSRRSFFFFFPENGIQLWRHTWAAATPAPAYIIYSSCWWPAKTFVEVQIAASPASMKASFSSACTSSPLHSTRAPIAIRQIVSDRDCRKCCCLYSWWLWRKTGGLPFLAQDKFKELM